MTKIIEFFKTCKMHICDKIKGNESDVADIVVEKLAKKELNFF